MTYCKVLGATLAFLGFSLVMTPVFASGPPPNPTVYSGSVKVDGDLPEDSVFEVVNSMNKCIKRCVFAKVGSYTSMASIIRDGKYALVVGPSNTTFNGGKITFHYNDKRVSAELDNNTLMAAEFDEFSATDSFQLKTAFGLTFSTEEVPVVVGNKDSVTTDSPLTVKSSNSVNSDADSGQQDGRVDTTKSEPPVTGSELRTSPDVPAKEVSDGNESATQLNQPVGDQSGGGGCMMSSGSDLTMIIAFIVPPVIMFIRRKTKK